MRDKERFSDEGLTDGEWKIIYHSKSRLEACSLLQCMSSLTLSSTRSGRHWIQSVLQQYGQQVRSSHDKVTVAQTEMTLQVSRLTLKGTCVWVTHHCKYCTCYKHSCRKPGTPSGSMLTAKVHVSTNSVFCTGPGALDLIGASTIQEKKAEAVMRSNNCKNRNDIAGQSVG